MDDAKLFNFKMDARLRALLEWVAEQTRTSLSGVVIDSIRGNAALLKAAHEQTFESMRTLYDHIGEDGLATIAVHEGTDGRPLAFLIMGTKAESTERGLENTRGLKAVAYAFDGRAHIYLDIPAEFAPAPTAIKIGEESVRIPSVQLKVGDLPWPPSEHEPGKQREAIHLSMDDFAARFPGMAIPDTPPPPNKPRKPAKQAKTP